MGTSIHSCLTHPEGATSFLRNSKELSFTSSDRGTR